MAGSKPYQDSRHIRMAEELLIMTGDPQDFAIGSIALHLLTAAIPKSQSMLSMEAVCQSGCMRLANRLRVLNR